jgi:nucleoid-associated protein YgaU
MDPASVFVLYLAGVLCLWLTGTVVHPAFSVLSHVGVMLPVGRRFLALAISVVLVAGVARAGSAEGSVGPPSHRMVQMVEDTSVVNTSGIVTAAHRPMANASRTTHTVEPGDSLWKIARGLLSSDNSAPTGGAISDLWRSIYELNRDLIGDDPNLILPGQVFQLPGR